MQPITNDTVASQIGICYLDPYTETLKEIVSDSGFILGADSYTHLIHKLFLVMGSEAANIGRTKVKLRKTDEISMLFDIKVLPGTAQPTVEEFSNIPNYNSVSIDGPFQAHSFIPIYIMINSRSKINTTARIPIEVSYDPIY